MQRGWVGDVADLFFFWISKAASRHNCSSKLGKFCSRFVVGWASLRGLAGSGAAKIRHLFGLWKGFEGNVWKQRWFKHPHAGIAVHRCITCMGILYEITENDNLILPFFTSLSSLLCRCSCGGCSCHSLCRHFSFPQGYRWHPLWLMCQRYWSQCHSI